MIPAQSGFLHSRHLMVSVKRIRLTTVASPNQNPSARTFRPVYEEAGAATTKWTRHYETGLAPAKSFDEINSAALG
jgi:hypothetical protein